MEEECTFVIFDNGLNKSWALELLFGDDAVYIPVTIEMMDRLKNGN